MSAVEWPSSLREAQRRRQFPDNIGSKTLALSQQECQVLHESPERQAQVVQKLMSQVMRTSADTLYYHVERDGGIVTFEVWAVATPATREELLAALLAATQEPMPELVAVPELQPEPPLVGKIIDAEVPSVLPSRARRR